jgi:hypothetical protein
MPEASGEPMSQRPTLFIALATALPLYMSAPIALANSSSDAFIELLNSLQSHHAGQGITYSNQGSNDEPGTPTNQTAEEYYISDLDAVVQLNCVVCHKSGGNAPNSGARLVFNSSAEANHVALSDFVSTGGGNPDWVLSKIAGGSGHGGGQIVSSGSNEYQAFEQYFALLSGDATSGSGDASDFWEGIVMEPREVTLRRASLLLAARVASDESIERAKASDDALRGELIKLMRGDGFHDFLTSGANDQLLTDGLMVRGDGGIEFDYDPQERYPAFSAFANALPESKPQSSDQQYEYLYEKEAWWDLDWTARQEPLELIAYVVMSNQSYKEILTANYTMVNPVSNIAFRSGLSFEAEYPTSGGLYSRKLLSNFKPGRNHGYVLHKGDYSYDYEDVKIESFDSYQDWPHVGILSTHAWLNRYPSTDTNRNRARARWTYYHFLGVDIEKSAPRTTDPVALADTNNPTMNNPACTVCHERLDPVAGAYQVFGDAGNYLDQWEGLDSLSETYKFPHRFGGDREDTPYQEGDTWYRDMRAPGFEGKTAPKDEDSLRWLAQQIVEDPRFASATVDFWWPAVYGSDPLIAPEDPASPDYKQDLRAFNAQAALKRKLAQDFIASDYRLKSLLADMIMAPWYRSEIPSSLIESGDRDAELKTIGRGRLLTPRELDNKNTAVFGLTWFEERTGNTENATLEGGGQNVYDLSALHRRRNDQIGYNLFYGGIDGASMTKRNRDLTPLMVNLSKQMSVDLACQAVAYDFSLSQSERVMFTEVERDTFPGNIASQYVALPGRVADSDSWLEQEPIIIEAAHFGGALRLQISDLTTSPGESSDGENAFARLAITDVSIKQGEEERLHLAGYELPEQSGFSSAIWVEPDTGERNTYGRVLDAKWALAHGGWMSLEVDLPEGTYELAVTFATRLSDNNLNEAVRAHIAMTSESGSGRNASTQAIERQIARLYLRATNTRLSDAQVRQLATVLHDYSIREFAREHERYNDLNWNSGENWCVDWGIFSIGGKIRENPSLEHARYNDPRAMVRAWTMLTQHIMSSFGYLHD